MPFPFFDLNFWLDPQPSYQTPYFWPLVGFFGVVFLVSLLESFLFRGYFPSFVTTPLYVTAIVILLLLFFRNQSLPFLSARILLLLAVITGMVWLAIKTKRGVLAERRKKKRLLEDHGFEKYLPKPVHNRPKKKD